MVYFHKVVVVSLVMLVPLVLVADHPRMVLFVVQTFHQMVVAVEVEELEEFVVAT